MHAGAQRSYGGRLSPPKANLKDTAVGRRNNQGTRRLGHGGTSEQAILVGQRNYTRLPSRHALPKTIQTIITPF